MEKADAQVCSEHQLSEQLLISWKKRLLAHADLVSAQERELITEQNRLAELERMAGQLTMELGDYTARLVKCGARISMAELGQSAQSDYAERVIRTIKGKKCT